MLNKEFSKKDIQRMRNLITGNVNDKDSSIIGFLKDSTVHEEGDTWEKDGESWEYKDGVIQNVSQLSELRKSIKMPMFCPSCKKIMNNRNDKTFFPIHRKCFNCVIDFEAQLKKEGKFEEYENNIHNSEIDARIEEFNRFLDENMGESNEQFITEDGTLEKWDGNLDKERIEKYRTEGIEYLLKLKR